MPTFYDHQEKARSSSTLMLLMLAISIAVTTVMTGAMLTLWLFVPLYWLFIKAYPNPHLPTAIQLHADELHPTEAFLVEHFPWMQEFPWDLLLFFFAVIVTSTAAAIIATTRAKMKRLREAGGVGVAESLGGVCISAESYRGDEQTRQAVNVVNEIAIASRIPPPHVFMLYDEPGINAFAVGFTSRDTAIGLTAGCVRHLNREQLQGVVAHEFAHIANGDTRTNILLVGYLHGLMGIVITAQSLVQNGVDLLVKSISHGGQGIVGFFIAAIGVLLWPVGLVGLICATIVKAAYSRQREHLADASAIEFSRNDVGLLGALKRILGEEYGSRVRSPRCLALSHAFFAKSCVGIAGWLDSHPPIEKRILKIDAAWDGQPQFEDEHDVAEFDGVFDGTLSIAQQARNASCGRLTESFWGEDLAPIITAATTMQVMEHAADIRASIPPDLWDLTQDVATAEAMVFALWASGQCETNEDDAELAALGSTYADSKQVADALQPYLEEYGLAERLMLFDAAVNLLRGKCQEGQLGRFSEKAKSILEEPADGDLFRWSWRKTVEQLLNRHDRKPFPKSQFGDVSEVLDECEVVLSALAYANESVMMKDLSLLRAANLLGHDLELRSRDECTLAAVDRALEKLRLLAPKARRKFLLAGSTSIESDSAMNEAEALLMRGICSGLGYPPATLLPGQPVSLN